MDQVIETTTDSPTPQLPDGYLERSQRKTILLLSDDLRLPSGIGTMAREIVLQTCHRFNCVNLGAGINHPELGKIADLSQSIKDEMGIPDAYVRVYPYNGYGDPGIVRHLLKEEKIDCILHFTDPRYWEWLYHMEHELRGMVPLCFYSIWDDLPYPKYNRDYYRSCDAIFPISKQTHNIVKQVLGEENVDVLDLWQEASNV